MKRNGGTMPVDLPNICLIGEAGAGKTTVAELLVKRFGYTKLSFAEPLKVMLDTTTDRHRLQEFGTDVVRAYEPDAWVRLFLWIKDAREAAGWKYHYLADTKPGPYVVDDARFLNEVMALVQDDWIVVRVVAPRHVRVDRLRRNGKLQDEAQLEHSSETELIGYRASHVVLNDSPFATDLEPEVEDLVNAVRS
jgi:dephospho-CoA kinase